MKPGPVALNDPHRCIGGALRPAAGTIPGNIGRSPRNRRKMAVVRHGGKPAVTRYETLARYGPAAQPLASLLRCRLETGRTHQIRVHLAAIGHPLIGDPQYGRPRRATVAGDTASVRLNAFARQALHAETLAFDHPAGLGRMQFSADLPLDFKELISFLEFL